MEEYDSSKLENSGWRLFIDYFKEFYHFEFEELSNDYKDEAIEYILLNHKDIFQREDVLRENLCTKCGLCCKELRCPHHDSSTNLCTKHDNQESIVCSTYPWDDDIGFILTLNCGYQKKYVHKFLDAYFTKAIEMRKSNGKKE